MKSTKKVIVAAGLDSSLTNFRSQLLRAIVDKGHEVVAIAPSFSTATSVQLAEWGIRSLAVPFARTGVNPLADLKVERELVRFLQDEMPDVFFGYTIKPIVYGTAAARKAGVPQIYALVTGLGSPFNMSGVRGWFLRLVATRLYRRALRVCSHVMVQNCDIGDYLVRRGILRDTEKLTVVSGSGVDLHHFSCVPLPSGPPVFLFVGRLLRDKGVQEYVAAAQILRTHHPECRILLVGGTDSNPTAIPAQVVECWRAGGGVEVHGAVIDVRPFLAACSVFVLPSYHEGMPRSVLEAMATGRPIITTDAIGCRDTIVNACARDSDGIRTGENGFMVPVGSVKPLALAMIRLASNGSLAKQMGDRSREIARERFDVHNVNRVMLRLMKL